MEKKTYLIPQTTVVEVEQQLMKEFSGKSTTQGGPKVGGIDYEEGTNRSRNHGAWDNEDE